MRKKSNQVTPNWVFVRGDSGLENAVSIAIMHHIGTSRLQRTSAPEKAGLLVFGSHDEASQYKLEHRLKSGQRIAVCGNGRKNGFTYLGDSSQLETALKHFFAGETDSQIRRSSTEGAETADKGSHVYRVNAGAKSKVIIGPAKSLGGLVPISTDQDIARSSCRALAVAQCYVSCR